MTTSPAGIELTTASGATIDPIVIARWFFRPTCKVRRKRRYILARREPLGAFDLARPCPASTPADLRKARTFDADLI
jgi:hypothetical protein